MFSSFLAAIMQMEYMIRNISSNCNYGTQYSLTNMCSVFTKVDVLTSESRPLKLRFPTQMEKLIWQIALYVITKLTTVLNQLAQNGWMHNSLEDHVICDHTC